LSNSAAVARFLALASKHLKSRQIKHTIHTKQQATICKAYMELLQNENKRTCLSMFWPISGGSYHAWVPVSYVSK